MDTQIAWAACTFCVYIAVNGGINWLQESPRLFTAMALFALSWAILLPYYGFSSVPSQYFQSFGSESLPAFAGILQIYCGTLVLQEGRARMKGKDTFPPRIGRSERWCLFLLPFIAGIPSGSNLLQLGSSILVDPGEYFIATILTLMGYFALYKGIKCFCGKREAKILGYFILLPYAIMEVLYTLGHVFKINLPSMAYFFSGAKVLLCLAFLVFIVQKQLLSQGMHLKFFDFAEGLAGIGASPKISSVSKTY